MSGTQQSNKKKKKKQNTNENANSLPQTVPEIAKTSNTVEKLDPVIKEILPNKIGMTTKLNDVEVTLTHNGNEPVNGTSKKKKKKKKSKQTNGPEGESQAEEKENEKLLHFTENYIELVNHPEISVSISTEPVVQVQELPKSEKKVDQKIEKNEPPKQAECSKQTEPPASSKKKKKKKKKNNTVNGTAPETSPAEAPEDAHSSPTYVKLPADGGNCVLLVSHESFKSGNQLPPNPMQDSPNETATVLIKKKETVNDSPPSTSNVQNNSSVSIFPVYSDPNKKPEKSSEFNVNSSLGKISDMIKNENENSSVTSNTHSNVAESASSVNEETKTKAQLKAERRAIQEAQRAAKLAKNSEKDGNINEQNKKTTNVKQQQAPKHSQTVNTVNNASSSKDNSKASVEKEVIRKVHLFLHLPQHQNLLVKQVSGANFKVPLPIFELGSHYNDGTLCGSNARCVGFLAALRQVIMDYRTPNGKNFSKDLESKLPSYLEFLGNCRPLSVSIINAMKFLKHQINHISEGTNEEKAKESLCQSINNYVREEILLAKEAITISASAKIMDNDTVLIFAYSSLVKDVLCKAHDDKKQFRVIIVDSRAKLEGLKMLRELVKYGLRCCYISINAVSSVIKKVNKVIIGAHALLANGYVMSRLGCKILSLVGFTSSVPVLVCCETYKFWERSLTDSIVHNELGNPDDLITKSLNKKDGLLKWQEISSLNIYNLLYDVTPSELISVVITEKGLIPCTSVPVLLRVKHATRQE